MTAESGNLPLLLLAALLAVGGLQGIFFYSSLGKKTASWFALQLGLVLFFLGGRSPLPSLSKVLALEILLVTAVVGLVLAGFLLWVQEKPLKGPLKAGGRRGFK